MSSYWNCCGNKDSEPPYKMIRIPFINYGNLGWFGPQEVPNISFKLSNKEHGQNGEVVAKMAHEHMASTLNGVFGKPGDLGSFVFDQYGGLMCIFLAGNESLCASA